MGDRRRRNRFLTVLPYDKLAQRPGAELPTLQWDFFALKDGGSSLHFLLNKLDGKLLTCPQESLILVAKRFVPLSTDELVKL